VPNIAFLLQYTYGLSGATYNMSLKELTIEYHRLQDRADEHYDNFLSIYQGLESMDHSEKESQLLEARNYLGRASDDLRE
jgi:hypothetical protein